MNWQEFAQQDPELAALGQERLDRHGLVMVATLRKNGWPRISPVEPLFFNGQPYLGMMWRSQKALDLLRGPRCCVHNAVSDRMATDGEFKVYGRALDITNPEERQEYLKAPFQKKTATNRWGTNSTASPSTSRARRPTRWSTKHSNTRCGKPANPVAQPP